MNTFDRIARLIGVFVISCAICGLINLIDFHVCIKGPGECKIITMDEYKALTEAKR